MHEGCAAANELHLQLQLEPQSHCVIRSAPRVTFLAYVTHSWFVYLFWATSAISSHRVCTVRATIGSSTATCSRTKEWDCCSLMLCVLERKYSMCMLVLAQVAQRHSVLNRIPLSLPVSGAYWKAFCGTASQHMSQPAKTHLAPKSTFTCVDMGSNHHARHKFSLASCRKSSRRGNFHIEPLYTSCFPVVICILFLALASRATRHRFFLTPAT